MRNADLMEDESRAVSSFIRPRRPEVQVSPKRHHASFNPQSAIRNPLWQSLRLAARVFVLFVGFERGLVESAHQPVEEDFGLATLVRPARAVEHRQGHGGRVVPWGAGAGVLAPSRESGMQLV